MTAFFRFTCTLSHPLTQDFSLWTFASRVGLRVVRITNIAIIGVGGVGGYFGGKLCQLLKDHPPLSISFVARGDHLRAIQQSGLLLSSESEGDILCTPSLATD